MTKEEFQYVVKQTAAGVWLEPTPELIAGTRKWDPKFSEMMRRVRAANAMVVAERDIAADYALGRIGDALGPLMKL